MVDGHVARPMFLDLTIPEPYVTFSIRPKQSELKNAKKAAEFGDHSLLVCQSTLHSHLIIC